jgi:hypothetical protein
VAPDTRREDRGRQLGFKRRRAQRRYEAVVGQCRRIDATRQRADRLKRVVDVVAEAAQRGRFCGAAARSLARQLGGE